jgi:hypothetical protein
MVQFDAPPTFVPAQKTAVLPATHAEVDVVPAAVVFQKLFAPQIPLAVLVFEPPPVAPLMSQNRSAAWVNVDVDVIAPTKTRS